MCFLIYPQFVVLFCFHSILCSLIDIHSLLFGDRSGGLDNVDSASGNSGRGDEGTVLGTDHVQVRLSHIGTILGSLQFALETTGTGDGLLGHALL